MQQDVWTKAQGWRQKICTTHHINICCLLILYLIRKTCKDVVREAEVLRANIKNLQMKTDKLMGNHEKKMEQNLNNIKVTNELYFGIDIYVDKFMHRIYKDFIEGRNTLLDWFRHV